MHKPIVFYIAAHQQKLAMEAKYRIEETGHIVNSRWITTEDIDTIKPEKAYEACSIIDVEDAFACDQLVLITEPCTDRIFHKRRNAILSLTTGGKHVEFGIALGQGKPLHVIGEWENIFHFHPSVTLYKDLDDFISMLELNNE